MLQNFKSEKYRHWKMCFGITIILAAFVSVKLWVKTSPENNQLRQDLLAKNNTTNTNLLPFALDQKMAISDFYFGPHVEYDPNDKTFQLMRQMAMALMEAMDNPKHPCNPLITAKTKIVAINISPRAPGTKIYTLWLSDGTTTCGLEAMNSAGLMRDRFKGDFFNRFFLRDMAGGFGYNSKEQADALTAPDKKSFWKQDIGEAAHDMAIGIGGENFFDNTLPQQYSGFSVADALNAGYSDGKYEYMLFTKNVVDAVATRTDLPNLNPYDTYAREKFQVFVQAVPTNNSLSFKVVYVDAPNNGYDPAVLNGSQNTATRLR